MVSASWLYLNTASPPWLHFRIRFSGVGLRHQAFKKPSRWFFKNSFIHMCIHCLSHFSPPAPLPPHPPSLLGRTCSALISNFVEEKTQHKKDQAFLLVKCSYMERFLALLPCTNVLQPKLIHL
jgi:hypothetical protein